MRSVVEWQLPVNFTGISLVVLIIDFCNIVRLGKLHIPHLSDMHGFLIISSINSIS